MIVTHPTSVYGVMQTAIENKLKPQDYLNYVFVKFQVDRDVSPEELLPWSESILEYCKNKNLTV